MKKLYKQKFVSRLLLSLCFIGFSIAINAQSSFSGIVKTENDQIISSANVLLSDSLGKVTKTALTDNQGTFLFSNIPLGGTYKLLVTAIGYDTFVYANYHPTINNPKFSLLIRLSEALATIDEVVVIAYGTQKQKEVTGSISKINVSDISTSSITSLDQFLAGRAVGVQAYQTAGDPGSNTAFRVRGVGSVTAGTQPLIVIDGFPMIYGSNLSSINHDDIASIEVLKDAASSSIYGSRASNGVVLITTKKGVKDGRTTVGFDNFYGGQQVTREVALMDAYQRATLTQDAANNYWVSLNPSVNKTTDPNSVRTGAGQIPDFVLPYIAQQKGLINTNWQDVIFRQSTIQNYNLSVTGGTPKLQFYISGNYLNQDGIVVNSKFKRYTTRVNFNTQVNSKVRVGVNFTPSYSAFDKVANKSLKKDGVIFSALLEHPHLSPYNPDGRIALNLVQNELASGIAPIENPLALAMYNQTTSELTRILMGTFLEVDLLKNLTYKTFVSGDYFTSRTNTFHPTFLAEYNVAAPTQSAATSSTQRVYNYLIENTLNYTNSYRNHHLDALVGYTFQDENTQNNNLSAINLATNQVTTITTGLVTGGGSSVSEWSLISYLARVNYNYKHRYLLGASIRDDGSSRFGTNNRWGLFPSFSAGWRIADESFFKKRKSINDLKIRGSYGRTGNFFIPDYGYVALLSTSNYVFNNSPAIGLSDSTAPNPNLSWEKTDMFNIGFDAVFFKNKLRISADYYNSKTKALLLNVPVPEQSGYSTSLQNIGRVENTGFEFVISTDQKIGKVKWSGSVNFSTNKNKVLDLGSGQTQIISGTTNITKVGGALGAFYGYKVIGVYQNSADLAKYPHLTKSKIGDYIYVDAHQDGVIDDKDRVVLGKSQPDVLFGFSNSISYKKFTFSFLLQGCLGFQIYNQLKSYTLNSQGWSNGAEALYNGYYRSASNPGTGYAAPNAKPDDNLYQTSNYMVENGDFIRLRSATLSYKLSEKITKKLFNASVFVTGKNLFTITKYSGYNPEVSNNGSDPLTPGIDYGVYPVEKNVVFGTKIIF